MNILYTAFNGKTNSSKILLDNINTSNKLYLKNSFITSVKELIEELNENTYDLIISFGQAPLDIDTIKIELVGTNNIKYKTTYNYTNLKNILESNNYKVHISTNAGNYLCNNLYYNTLKYINDNNLKTKVIFIHIPKINNITNIISLANLFKNIY